MDRGRVELRAGRDDDFEFLWRLQCEAMRPNVERQFGAWDEARQRERFEATTDPTSQEIVELDGRRVGCQWVRIRPDALELVRIQLLPRVQGHGIGTALVEWLLARASRAGLPLRLRVFRTSPARALYTRLGFATVGETDSHVYMEHPAACRSPRR